MSAYYTRFVHGKCVATMPDGEIIIAEDFGDLMRKIIAAGFWEEFQSMKAGDIFNFNGHERTSALSAADQAVIMGFTIIPINRVRGAYIGAVVALDQESAIIGLATTHLADEPVIEAIELPLSDVMKENTERLGIRDKLFLRFHNLQLTITALCRAGDFHGYYERDADGNWIPGYPAPFSEIFGSK